MLLEVRAMKMRLKSMAKNYSREGTFAPSSHPGAAFRPSKTRYCYRELFNILTIHSLDYYILLQRSVRRHIHFKNTLPGLNTNSAAGSQIIAAGAA